MLTFVMSFLLIVLPAAATLESQLLAALPNSAAAACSAAGDGSSNCSANVRSDDYPRTLREIEAYVALLEGKLEERLEKHEQQQWEQQRKLFVLLAVSICLAVVFIVALAACKVYVQSLQNQMQCSFQGEEQRGIQNSSVSGMHTPSVGGTPKKPSLPRSHSKLSSTEVPGDPPKERWSNSWWIEDTYPTATNGKALRDELGDDQDVCLHPSSEDVGELPLNSNKRGSCQGGNLSCSSGRSSSNTSVARRVHYLDGRWRQCVFSGVRLLLQQEERELSRMCGKQQDCRLSYNSSKSSWRPAARFSLRGFTK